MKNSLLAGISEDLKDLILKEITQRVKNDPNSHLDDVASESKVDINESLSKIATAISKINDDLNQFKKETSILHSKLDTIKVESNTIQNDIIVTIKRKVRLILMISIMK
jgi:septal ring factor EnvC (AmiA/AmiB activator)